MKNTFITCCCAVAVVMLFAGCTKRVVEPNCMIAETEQIGGPYWRLHGITFVDELTGILHYDYQSLMKTTDGGVTWTEIFATQQGSLTAFAYPQRDTIYAFTQASSSADHDVHRSVDGGATWSIISQVADEVLPAFFNGKTGFAMSAVVPNNQIRLIRTTNAGATWTNVGNYNDNTLAMGFASPLIGWAINTSSQFLRTTDGGVTWNTIVSGIYNATNMTTDGTAYAYERGNGIIKTTDFGATWTLLLAESSNASDFSDVDVRGQNIVAIHNQNLLVSRDGGATWVTYVVRFNENQHDFRMYDVWITDPDHVLIYERTSASSGDHILLRATL